MTESDFRSFYEAEFQKVYASVFSLTRNTQDAEDAAQEAFARAFVRWRRLSGMPWRLGWVISTALNVARKEWTRKHRRVRHVREGGRETSVRGSSPHETVDALKRLPKRQMEAVYLHYVVDLSVEDVAAIMGISGGAVKSHLSRGRRALTMQTKRVDE